MTVTDPNREYNMAVLRLNDEQYDRYCELLKMNPSAWPEPLARYIQAAANKLGFSGGMVTEKVAEWIRIHEPFAIGQRVAISLDSPTSAGRSGYVMEIVENEAVIDFRDGTGLADYILLEHLSNY